MATVLVFAGAKYYAKGGASDLRATLRQPPAESDLTQIFVAAAGQEGWLPDDFWMHTLSISDDGKPVIERWLVFIRDNGDELDFKEAPYATVTVGMGSFKVLFVPIAERVQGESAWTGPRDVPDVVFY